MEILKVDNISKSFNKSTVVENISFSINEGEVIGLVGPNGAGKTTTLKMITNLIYADKGTININGYDLIKEREKALENIGAIIETPGLYKNFTGKQNIDYIREIRNISKNNMEQIIQYIGLQDNINMKVKKYSLGMKQRLALGMCLVTNPKFLVLDEPTNGLDPTGTKDLRDMIKKLSKEKNIAVLISSHMLSEVEKNCDKIIFIKKGKIISINDNKINRLGKCYEVSVDNSNIVHNILKECNYVYEFNQNDKNKFTINFKDDGLSKFLKILTNNQVNFSDINEIKYSIEAEYDKIYKET